MNDDVLVPDRLLATARPPQPYPGLRPFEMEEWSIFFGRERMIDEVIELLARQRLVVVHGASGSGKSSLIRAGVLPRLARQHLRHGVPWRTAAMRPSGGPLWNLAVALARLEGRDGDVSRVETIRRAFDRPDARLRDAVAKEIGLAGQQVCILVDQFEELFRYAREISRDESQLFIELFAGLPEDNGDSGVHAVVTLRSEFLGECARYDGLAEAINRTQYLLPRMDREGLLRAIRRPAELYGGTIDADLAERLIADAGGGQDELPLIQHALLLLWDQVSEKAGSQRRLGLDLYRRQEGGVAALLSDHASRVMAAAAPDPPQQTVVELLFRALTDINAEGQGTRRPQRFDRLVAVTGGGREMLRGIINAFRAEGVSFLTPYPPVPIEDATIIDISHEALIRCWRRIADPEHGWLQREFQDGLIWRSLLAPAERFEKNPKDVLSPALTEDRRVWLEGRPPAWCERYGDGWQPVTELMEASEAAAAKARRHDAWRRRVFWAPLLLLGVVGLWMAADRGLDEWQRWQRAEKWHQAMTTVKEGRASEPVKDCDACPEMVVVPPGTFRMGSPESDTNAAEDEKPQHPVTIAEPFAIGRYEVTKAEYAAFITATYPRGTGCYVSIGDDWGLDGKADWREPGFALTDRDPVVCVSWLDAQAYVEWLSRKTGVQYRLPTEAEWEYGARAGTTTRYAFGDVITPKDANYTESKLGKTTEVGSYPPNAWGLYDMHGNVWEWVEDAWHNSYKGEGVPTNGAAWTDEEKKPSRLRGNRVIRGGSWINIPRNLRSALRGGMGPNGRNDNVGFRVARTPQRLPEAVAAIRPPQPPEIPEPHREPPGMVAVERLLSNVRCSALEGVVRDRTLVIDGYLGNRQSLAAVLGPLAQASGGLDVSTDQIREIDPLYCRPLEVLRSFVAANRDRNLSLAVSTAGTDGRFREGDKLLLTIKVPEHDSYIYVDYFSLDGNVVHMLPNPTSRDNRLAASGQTTLGDGGPAGSWTVGEPFGTELITMISSPKPLFSKVRQAVEPSAGYLADLDKALAKVGMDAGTAGIDAEISFIRTEPPLD